MEQERHRFAGCNQADGSADEHVAQKVRIYQCPCERQIDCSEKPQRRKRRKRAGENNRHAENGHRMTRRKRIVLPVIMEQAESVELMLQLVARPPPPEHKIDAVEDGARAREAHKDSERAGQWLEQKRTLANDSAG